MHLRHSLRNKLPGGTNCPDPFDSCNTRGNFFSQLLDMTAPGKVCINELTLIPGLREYH